MEEKTLHTRREELKKKGKKGLLRLLFSRTGLVALILLANVGLAVYLAGSFGQYYFTAASVLSVVMTLVLLSSRSNAMVKVTWLVLFLVTPVFGTMLYLYTRSDLGHRALQRRVLPLVCRLLLQGHQHGYHGGVGDAALCLYAIVGNLYISPRQDVVVRIRLSSGDVKGIGLPLVGKHHDLGSRHAGDGSVKITVVLEDLRIPCSLSRKFCLGLGLGFRLCFLLGFRFRFFRSLCFRLGLRSRFRLCRRGLCFRFISAGSQNQCACYDGCRRQIFFLHNKQLPSAETGIRILIASLQKLPERHLLLPCILLQSPVPFYSICLNSG